MTRVSKSAAAVVGLTAAIAVAGCSPTADVTAKELTAVIERDGVPFDGASIPGGVLDRLAANRVVLLGETHHLREHWAFVADLLGELHTHGFRELLIESPQMAAWLLDDYVQGGLLAPLLRTAAVGARALNDTLPPRNESTCKGSMRTRTSMGAPETSRF